MSEKENKKETAKAEIECPSCGAKVSARRIYCPECGGIVRPDRIRKSGAVSDCASKDKAESAAAQSSDNIDDGNAECAAADTNEFDGAEVEKSDDTQNANNERNADERIETAGRVSATGAICGAGEKPCRKCGKPIELGSKFCKHCGAACVDDGAYCRFCGAHIPSDVNFCKNCGAPTGAVGGVGGAVYVPVSEEEVAKILADKRKKSATTISVVVLALSVLMFFFCSVSEFLTVKFTTLDGKLDISQDIITMIGVAFGGRSALTVFGVPIELLRFAGWLYLCYMIVLVAAVVCAVIDLARDKSTPPVGVGAVTVTTFLLSTAIFVLNLVAKSKVDTTVLPEAEVSAFMNGVGLFICGFIELFIGAGSCFISWVAYRGEAKKRSRGRIAFRIMSGAVAALMCGFVFAPAFAVEATDTLSPNESGKLTVSLTECVGDGCYGGAVIKFDGLEHGERYSLSLKTNAAVGSDFTAESLVLYRAEEVEGGCIVNAAFFGDILEINQTYGPNTAKLLFTADHSGELAVVAMFSYYFPLAFGIEYELSRAE